MDDYVSLNEVKMTVLIEKEIMLINATQPEEIRVALMKGPQLFDLDVERPADVKKKSNIYKCRITRIEPSLEAVFVEYGSKRQGFLPVKEIAQEFHLKKANTEENSPINIRELFREGQELMVQVDKEERGNKGAALTTYITLAGCYLVLMPNNPSSGGISRRIEGDEREELRDTLHNLNIPEGMGVIIRTAGVGKSEEDLRWDLDILLNQWKSIHAAYEKQPAPFLIYQEGDVIIRSIRDNLRRSIEEIIIDDHIAYTRAKNYIEQVKPSFLPHLKLYHDPIPLFSHYQIEGQIEAAYQRTVSLPSGGSLVIDRTEALVAIDINSAKSTGATDIENTAANTNLEAADEIARQLRLRDLGGLIVIDFIDMSSSKNQREVENRLRDALASDRAKIQVGRISRFGLLEMSRQRLRPALNESIQETCSHCEGKGMVRRPQSQALSLLRLIEEESSKETGIEIQVQLPVNIATFLLNEKRTILAAIEKRNDVTLLVLPNPYLQTMQHKIIRVKKDSRNKASFEQITLPELSVIETDILDKPAEQPAVQQTHNMTRHSDTQKEMVQGLTQHFSACIKRFWQTIFSAQNAATSNKSGAKGSSKEGHATSDDNEGLRRTHYSSNNRSRTGNNNNPNRRRHHNSGNAPSNQGSSNPRGGRRTPGGHTGAQTSASPRQSSGAGSSGANQMTNAAPRQPASGSTGNRRISPRTPRQPRTETATGRTDSSTGNV
jgi:ribonuclease E